MSSAAGCSGRPTTMIVRSPSGVTRTMSRVCGSMRSAAWMVAVVAGDLVIDVERRVVDADRREEVHLGIAVDELEEGDTAAAAGDDLRIVEMQDVARRRQRWRRARSSHARRGR